MKLQKNLLVIKASPRNERSRSRQVAAEFVSGWEKKHPLGNVIVRDLMKEPPSFVTEAWIEGAFAPEASRSPAARTAIAESDFNVDQLLAADEIMLAVPLYNLSIPAVLKAWIDQIVRVGRTFAVSENGYAGLVASKPVRVLVVSGGDFRPGTPAAGYNFLEPYLRGVFGFIGLTDVQFHYTVNQALGPDAASTALTEGIREARELGAA
jgi:FMN-dependent NADH-azoreductase